MTTKSAKRLDFERRTSVWRNIVCLKCGKAFSSSTDYLTHVQAGYPCGRVVQS